MSCRMRNRDKALRLPTIRRLRIVVTVSSNVRSGCSAISANNQLAYFSNGETLPPLGFAAELPSSFQLRSQLITELGLASRSAATSCREAPPSTIAIARARRSSEYGLAIPKSFEKDQGRQTRSSADLWESPRFDPDGICSSGDRPSHRWHNQLPAKSSFTLQIPCSRGSAFTSKPRSRHMVSIVVFS